MIQKIRILKSVSIPYAYFVQGSVLSVPDQITEDRAKAWVKAGIAEEDKMMEGPPEMKAVVVQEKKKKPFPIKKDGRK